MIITIIGGGSTFTPGIVKSIALRKDELDVDEIRLYDLDQERQDKVAVVVKWILEEELKSGIKLTITYDVEEAYRDADFIFAQMRVGKPTRPHSRIYRLLWAVLSHHCEQQAHC